MKRKYFFPLLLCLLLIVPQAIVANDYQEDQMTISQYTASENKEESNIEEVDGQNAASEKKETMNDDTITFEYQESEEKTGIQVHDRDVYVASDGSTATYDNVTGQLVAYTNSNLSNETGKISEDKALSIAKDFIDDYCDLSKYTLVDITYNDYSGYTIAYSKYISGYKTSEIISVSLSSTGNIQWYVYNPYVFDDITVNPFDENDIISKLENDVRSDCEGTFVSYKIKDKRLNLNDDGNVVLEFFVGVKYELNSELCSTGSVYSYTV